LDGVVLYGDERVVAEQTGGRSLEVLLASNELVPRSAVDPAVEVVVAVSVPGAPLVNPPEQHPGEPAPIRNPTPCPVQY
jgi:hypothetical protein